MIKIIVITFLFLGILTVPDLRAGNVAVIDLDSVARELNVLEHINATLKNKGGEMRRELITTQSELRGQLEQAISAIGEKPSDQDKREFLIKNQKLKTQYATEEQKKLREFQLAKSTMVNEFREQLKPIALKVAKEKGCTVILNTVMPPIYAFQETVDITKEVAAAAKQAGLTRTVPTLNSGQ